LQGNEHVTLKNIVGIDHAVVVVKDLDAAAANWKSLGFTVSPRGTHSAKMGSGNYTMMLGPDYVELLGVLNETEHNAPTRAFLAKRGDGIERIAFTTTDAAVGAEEIRARGYTPIGPTDFERPVTMPDGSLSAAKFATYQWPYEEAPGGLRIFACQHKTRETVWIPELQVHANTAKRLKKVFIVTPEPEKDAQHMAKLIDGAARSEADGAVTCRRAATARTLCSSPRTCLRSTSPAHRWPAFRSAAAFRWCSAWLILQRPRRPLDQPAAAAMSASSCRRARAMACCWRL
jgi:hypothetical protein